MKKGISKMIRKSVMRKLKHDAKSTIVDSYHSKNQIKTITNILIFAYNYLPKSKRKSAIKILTKSLTDQYWFSADGGIHHLLLGCYKILHPSAKKSFKKLQDQLKEQENKIEIYHDEFIKEPLLVNMLYNSFFVRYICFIWLHLFEHEKRLYTVEVLQDAHHELIFAKRLLYLLQGVILSDNKMHLSSFKGYPKQVMTKKQWRNSWKENAKYIPALWD